MSSPDPYARAARALERGADFRGALEELLLALPLDEAERLMQVLRESRAAWLPLAESSGGRALFAGDALSGTVVALARVGFEVVVVDADPVRSRIARARDRALAGGRARFVRGLAAAPPVAAGSCELVVCEPRDAAEAAALDLERLRRAARAELGVVCENRWAYKVSSGRRGDFRLVGPAAWLRRALGERSTRLGLAGHRRRVARPPLARSRAFALYPHSRDFSHVVGLDGRGPEITIGPKERANRWKMLAWRAGLFPLLAPSFAVVAGRDRASPRRDERLLAALAEAIGEPRPRTEIVVATRGNSALLLTAVPGARASDPAGRWAVHAPLSPQQRDQAERHFARLVELRRDRPDLPVPEPLFRGEVDGTFVACERRLPGLGAPQLSGEEACMARAFADAARHLATLVVEAPAALEGERFERLVEAKFELVLRHAADEGARAGIERLRERARSELRGLEAPLVLYHADLRSKHVQVDERGRVLGFLDWGSSEDAGLPYFDLLHLVVHERKQAAAISAGRAWREVAGGSLREHERRALDDYAGRLGLPAAYRSAIETIYPVLVGAMAEANWDYSRPRWLERNFRVTEPVGTEPDRRLATGARRAGRAR